MTDTKKSELKSLLRTAKHNLEFADGSMAGIQDRAASKTISLISLAVEQVINTVNALINDL